MRGLFPSWAVAAHPLLFIPIILALMPELYQSLALSSDLLLVSQDSVVVNTDAMDLKPCIIFQHDPHILFTIWPPFCNPGDSALALPANLTGIWGDTNLSVFENSPVTSMCRLCCSLLGISWPLLGIGSLRILDGAYVLLSSIAAFPLLHLQGT